MLASRLWRFEIDGQQHVVEIEPDDPTQGLPKAFYVDGQRHPIKLPISLSRRFEFPFEVGGHSGAVIMSVRGLSEVFWPRYKAAIMSMARLRGFPDVVTASMRAANAAIERCVYDVMVHGIQIEPVDPDGGPARP